MNSYLLTLGQCSQLGDPEQFWKIIEKVAKPVDSVEEDCGRVMEIILDYLATEASLVLPPGNRTGYSTKICAPKGDWIVTCLTRHEAALLQSRLAKKKIEAKCAEEILRAYGCWEPEMDRIASQCIEFLKRQITHLKLDEERLIIVIYGFHTKWKSCS